VAVQVEGSFSSLQVHGKEQAHQSQVMITMQVADEDVSDPVDVDALIRQLNLGSFTAIYQKMVTPDSEVLTGG
jgi:hypothetical protein